MNAKLCLAKDEAKLQGNVFPSKTWEQDKWIPADAGMILFDSLKTKIL
jgi:hypothetical protein